MDGTVPQRATAERRIGFFFTGQTRDYFLICLRTFLLAVVTLGIYDAWGTVERRRYLLGHTKLDGHGFDYHARPVTILIGRLIAVGVIVAYNVLVVFWPTVTSGAVSVAFLVGVPWLMIRALRFQLRNTSYRNVRFDFTGEYGGAFRAFILAPILVPFTLGLALPWVQRVGSRFIAKHMRFGDRAFALDMDLGGVYKVFLLTIVCSIASIAGAWFVAESVSQVWTVNVPIQGQPVDVPVLSIAVFIVMLFMIAACYVTYKGAFRNAVMNGASLSGGHRFASTLPIIRYGVSLSGIWLLASVSLGLLIPWATVLTKRMQIGHMTMIAAGPLDDFTAHGEDGGDATAAEFGTMEGITDGLLGGTF